MAKEENMILFRIEDNVGIITLNRPDKLNAISVSLAKELSELLVDIRYNDDVRAVLIHGAGRGFCAGADADFLSGDGDVVMPGKSDASRPMPRDQRKTPGTYFFEVTRKLVGVDKPTVAAIQGPAVGCGLAYALACDRRFGDSTAKMSAIFTNIGVAPDCGLSYFLPRHVGLSNALMMVETAKVFKADESKELGLLDVLTEEGKAFDEALAYAKLLAQRASVAVDIARRMVHMASQGSTLEEILDYEGLAGVIVAHSNDANEGIQSLLEKRKPVFTGS